MNVSKDSVGSCESLDWAGVTDWHLPDIKTPACGAQPKTLQR